MVRDVSWMIKCGWNGCHANGECGKILLLIGCMGGWVISRERVKRRDSTLITNDGYSAMFTGRVRRRTASQTARVREKSVTLKRRVGERCPTNIPGKARIMQPIFSSH